MSEHPSLVSPQEKPRVQEDAQAKLNLEEANGKILLLQVKIAGLTETARTLGENVEKATEQLDALEELEKRALELLIKRLEHL
jgi:predicted ATP-grasp superfamily ATP-dependent carboligase